MMTKQNYEAFAAALRMEQPASGSPAIQIMQWLHDLNAIAQVLAADNPNFDRARFARACGIPD